MIVIKVELHSAITNKVTILGKMVLTNDGTGDQFTGNYNGSIYRKSDFRTVTRSARVEGHKRKTEVIWVLVAKMLKNMGYLK